VAKVQVERSGRVYRIRVNDPDPLVPFHFMGEKVDQSDLPEEFKILEGSIPFQEGRKWTRVICQRSSRSWRDLSHSRKSRP